MKFLTAALTAAATTLLVTAASAAPLSPNLSATPDSDVQNVRMVCNENGRCWRERSERHVIIRDGRDPTDMRLASATSSGAAMKSAAASASALPA